MSDSDHAADRAFAEPQLGRPPSTGGLPQFTSRLQIKLDTKGRQKLTELCERMGLKTSDVIRDALRVYDLLTEELITKGNEVLLVDQEKETPERLLLFTQQKRAAA